MKTKRVFQFYILIIIILLIHISDSCKKDDPKIIKQKVTGLVQKGPYINGTSVTMSELNSSLSQTGNVFTAQITNNIGSFEIDNISLTSGYVEFSASGYYFDEVKGYLSVAPLNLFALSDIRDISTVNVNILTHLEKQRVDYLIKQNKTFSEAKNKSQGEILAIFGFSLNDISNSETLDITVNNEANAALLAISIILQGNRSVGDLTELLANISNDIREDGILTNKNILTDLRNSTKLLDLTSIRSNLIKRYQDLGITASIPDFEKYINDFLGFTGEKPTAVTLAPTDISTSGATFNGSINANSFSTTVLFQWGKTVDYTDSVAAFQSPATGISPVNVNVVKTGLLPGTTYHFRVKANNSLGSTYGDDLTFSTLGKVPSVTTLPATNLSTTGATLNASVNANLVSTTVMFKWGKTSIYSDSISATQSPVTGSSFMNVSADITGLSISSTYYVKAVATNSVGRVRGNEISFTISPGKIPTLESTLAVSSITSTTASSGGNVTSNGGEPITAYGICWSTTTGPTVSDNKTTISGSVSGTFSSLLQGLTANTVYYVKSYATNSAGTAYGSEISFKTYNADAITDINGNIYNTVDIGTQVWMAENLKTTSYSNGDLIGTTTPADLDISLEVTPKYQWPAENKESNVDTYGRLYTWYAATDSRNVCPTGWHVPSDAEWITLASFLGGESVAGGKLKEGGISHFASPNDGATNEYGFTGLPAGYRTGYGLYAGMTDSGIFWTPTATSLTEAWNRGIWATSKELSHTSFVKNYGFSVRCIKD